MEDRWIKIKNIWIKKSLNKKNSFFFWIKIYSWFEKNRLDIKIFWTQVYFDWIKIYFFEWQMLTKQKYFFVEYKYT